MDRCYYDQLTEQIRSQKLDSTFFFGPLNSLIQSDFLQTENIRFFITLGLDTVQLWQLWENNPLGNDTVLINFDPDFKFDAIRSSNSVSHGNVENFGKITSSVVNGDTHRPDLAKLVKYNPETLHTIYSDDWEHSIQRILDIAIIFKMASHHGKTLIVSKNGNDNILTSLLISIQRLQNPQLSTLDAFRFIKVQRPSVYHLTPDFFDLCNSINCYSLADAPVKVDKQSRKIGQESEEPFKKIHTNK